MDNADEITNLLAQIAREEAGLSQLSMVKETLQNEVQAKKGELQTAQGVKRKQQVKYTQANKAQKTLKPALHQTYKICNWLKHIYMRKQKTHFHPVKKTFKHKCKHQLKEENTNNDREYKREQNKCINTEQGNNQSKRHYTIMHKGYLLQDKIWKFLMRIQSMTIMWEIWTTCVLPVVH